MTLAELGSPTNSELTVQDWIAFDCSPENSPSDRLARLAMRRRDESGQSGSDNTDKYLKYGHRIMCPICPKCGADYTYQYLGFAAEEQHLPTTQEPHCLHAGQNRAGAHTPGCYHMAGQLRRRTENPQQQRPARSRGGNLEDGAPRGRAGGGGGDQRGQQYGQQRNRGHAPADSAGRSRCYNCGQEGHWSKDCPTKSAYGNAAPRREQASVLEGQFLWHRKPRGLAVELALLRVLASSSSTKWCGRWR